MTGSEIISNYDKKFKHWCNTISDTRFPTLAETIDNELTKARLEGRLVAIEILEDLRFDIPDYVKHTIIGNL